MSSTFLTKDADHAQQNTSINGLVIVQRPVNKAGTLQQTQNLSGAGFGTYVSGYLPICHAFIEHTL